MARLDVGYRYELLVPFLLYSSRRYSIDLTFTGNTSELFRNM
jgi:hypothetical protein